MLRTFATPLLLLAGCTAAIAPTAAAQAAPKPEFDVVSIKPNNSPNPGGSWGVWNNEYSSRNTPLSRIILQAYSGQLSASSDLLKDAPSWVMSDRYDITAKVDDATANSWKDLRQPQQVALAAPLLRTMLEDRCKLSLHTVPTLVDGYALVIGKHGIKMKSPLPQSHLPQVPSRLKAAG
jgi:uncharacterized protein (TIGR03435 family)